MDKFVTRQDQSEVDHHAVVDSVVSAAMARAKVKKEKVPWMSWPDSKKEHLASLFKKGGWAACKLAMGSVNVPKSTVRDWSKAKGKLRKPGRPGLLTEAEEQIVFDSIKAVRSLGGPVDGDGLVVLAEEALSKTREGQKPNLGVSWAASYRRRWELGKLRRVTSDRPVDSPGDVENDNKWRRTYHSHQCALSVFLVSLMFF
jgi:hypothetical protein